MPPLAGSPAIDAGEDSITNSLATDQRGYPRWSGLHVDIGAVEAQWASGNPPLLTGLVWSPLDGTFQFAFTNVANADFTVLASTNVAFPMNLWRPVGLATQSTPGQYQFSDSSGLNHPIRFFRVSSP